MSILTRLGVRQSRRRPASPRCGLELLETRTLLNGSIPTTTTLRASLPTEVTGAQEILGATVVNAETGAPIQSGHVTFVVESPQPMTLGVKAVSKLGKAVIATNDLTLIKNYQIEAIYTPSEGAIASGRSTPITVQVIPQPLHVPTAVTLEPGATLAESGQDFPVLAVVNDAGTGNQVDAGKVQEITGYIQIYTVSPRRELLGSIPINQSQPATTSSGGIISDIQSAFGFLNSSSTSTGEKQRVLIDTNKLTQVGPYRLQARFVPSNQYFRASTSDIGTVLISPRTQGAATVTSLQVSSNQIESGQQITLTATVQNPSTTLAGGNVDFYEEGKRPKLLGSVTVTAFGQPYSLTTDNLDDIGNHVIRAAYVPGNSLFAGSSATAPVQVTPLTASSFRVQPVRAAGVVGDPMTFTVTAINTRGHVVPNYTGTVDFYSPTDSVPNFPVAAYTALNIPVPASQGPGLVSFSPASYTFTAADHGSHTFWNAVRFGKPGAESVRVSQTDDTKVYGQTTFAIA